MELPSADQGVDQTQEDEDETAEDEGWDDNEDWGDIEVKIVIRHILTLYNRIITFDAPEEKAFLKHFEKKEKMLVISIFSFSHNNFYLF